MNPDTWVLLRGLTREIGHWGEFLPMLERAVAPARVVTLDLPGAGVRRHVAWPATIREALALVRADLERAAPAATRGRTFVFAVSLGGMLTLEWAARHAHELDGVVLGATSAGGAAPPWKRLRPGSWPGMLAAAVRRDLHAREHGIVKMVINRRETWAETASAWAAIQRERPMAPAQARAQIRSAIRFRAPRNVGVPALFMVGLGDRLVHPDCSRVLARRYGAPLITHPDAGHDLTHDAPAWVVDELRAFAGRIGARGTSAPRGA